MPDNMNPLRSAEAKQMFLSYVKETRKGMDGLVAEEKILSLINRVFSLLARNQGELEIEGHWVNVKDIGSEEVRALCKLANEFFKVHEDLHVPGELLANMEQVFWKSPELDSLKKQIYLNETIDVETKSPFETLQKQLRDEIKTNAVILKREEKKHNMKQRALAVGAAVGIVGAIAGGIALMALFSAGFVLPFIGAILAIVGVLSLMNPRVFVLSKNEAEIQKQKDRMWAFETLQNPQKMADELNRFFKTGDLTDLTLDKMLEARKRQARWLLEEEKRQREAYNAQMRI